MKTFAAIAVCALASAPLLAGPQPDRPAVWLLDAGALLRARARVQAGDASLTPALARLRQDADKALKAGPFTVTDKEAAPPSGDKHDYMSVAPYWWPDPNKPDGKPYIRRDGEVNPDRRKIGDADRLGEMTGAVQTLALAYFFTGHEPYAEHAARLLRVWFLDPATRMNPNLRYGQAVPGITDGRGIGIVDTSGMPRLVDAVGLLQGAKAWSEADRQAMREWFGRFLDWLLESPLGKAEQRAANNHSTQYDVQVASYALFAGRKEVARKVLEEVPARRIDKQIEPDGAQPQELARTKSWDYSCFNLQHWLNLALLGEHVGVDLWGYQSRDGRSIRKALDYLLPYAAGEKAWNHPQIVRFVPARIAPTLRLAAVHFRGEAYAGALAKLKEAGEDPNALLWVAGKE